MNNVDPHNHALSVMQDRYRADHPYKAALLGDLTFEDVQRDPEMRAEYDKMFMQLTNAQNDSSSCDSSISSCPLQNKQPLNTENPNCKLAGIKITKKKRNFDLVVVENNPSAIMKDSNPENVLEVVGGRVNTVPKIDIELNGLVHNCPTHQELNHWSIVYGNEIQLKDSTASIEAPSEFQLLVLPWSPRVKEYRISANTCSNKLSAIVRSYPDIDVSLKLTYKKSKSEKTKHEYQVEMQRPKRIQDAYFANSSVKKFEVIDLSSNLQISASITQSGETISFGKAYSKVISTLKLIDTIYENSVMILGRVSGGNRKKVPNKGNREAKAERGLRDYAEENDPTKELAKNEDRSAEGVVFPSITIGVGGKWEEESGQYFCDFNGYVEVAADPFIGYNFKKDISHWILSTFPAGKAIGYLKEFLYDLGVEALAVNIFANSSVTGSLRYYPKRFIESKVEGKISGKIEIGIEAVALKLTKQVPLAREYSLTVKIDVSIGGKSGFWAEAMIVASGDTTTIQFKGGVLAGVVFVNAVVDSSVGKTVAKKPYSPPVASKEGTGKPKKAENNPGSISITLWNAFDPFNLPAINI